MARLRKAGAKVMGYAMATVILKICTAGEWAEAELRGLYDGSAVDAEDGFIHFSTPEQAPETAARYFADQADLVVVAVDPESLGPALAWEPSRGGDLFPHLYGPLPLGTVLWVRPLPLGADGRHRFPL